MNPDAQLRFQPGSLLATPGADALLRAHDVAPVQLLARHLSGDWGELCAEDRKANEAALKTGARLLSCYRIGGERLWIITDAAPGGDPLVRATTTFLLPSEY